MDSRVRFRMKLRCEACGAEVYVGGATRDDVYDAADRFLLNDCERGHLPVLPAAVEPRA